MLNLTLQVVAKIEGENRRKSNRITQNVTSGLGAMVPGHHPRLAALTGKRRSWPYSRQLHFRKRRYPALIGEY